MHLVLEYYRPWSKEMKKDIKKILIAICVATLFVTSFPLIGTKVSKAENNYGLENPRVEYMTRDIVEFGHYWQEDTNGDGKADENDEKTPIRWQVLERNGDELLLLSDKILDRKKYNEEDTEITWENCTLRSWLNNEFYDNAFSSEEKTGINESSISNPDNPKYGTEGGNDTKDRVFLLSIDEVTNYGFSKESSCFDQARHGKVTAYAKKKDFWVSIDGNGRWCLRSPGKEAKLASGVFFSGSVSIDGMNVAREGGYDEKEKKTVYYHDGIRPALRINISSLAGYVKELGKENVALQTASWDTVTFGNYNGNNLTWRVLSVSGDDAFLLSDKIIADKEYNEKWADITWENCTLRTWLNNDFYNDAFNSDEKAIIKDTDVINDENGHYGTLGGNNTTDKVYLLSLSEIMNTDYGFPDACFCDSDTRIAYVAGSTKAGSWWLRSPGIDSFSSVRVSNLSCVDGYGDQISDSFGVRPVLHINLSSSVWTKGEKVSSNDVPKYIQTPVYTPTPTATVNPVITDNTSPSEEEKTLTLSSVKCKKNTKKITGRLSVSGATVKIKVGKKAAKKSAVKGKKFTLKLSYRLKKKTKVTITVTKKDYKTLKKVYVVK